MDTVGEEIVGKKYSENSFWMKEKHSK